jgi:hypothetical protein
MAGVKIQLEYDLLSGQFLYFISRLKLNTRIYIKNPEPEFFNNGTLKKQTEYIQLDMTQMMSVLTLVKRWKSPIHILEKIRSFQHVS